METVLITLLILVAAVVTLEFINWVTFGGYVKCSVRDFEKLLSRPALPNGKSINWWHYEFAAHSFGLTSKWYIQGVGRVKRGSIYEKMLDKKFSEIRLLKNDGNIALKPGYYL